MSGWTCKDKARNFFLTTLGSCRSKGKEKHAKLFVSGSEAIRDVRMDDDDDDDDDAASAAEEVVVMVNNNNGRKEEEYYGAPVGFVCGETKKQATT